ncbi:MAG TPA: bifunctional folylpolyglutamate synthase/dihydrofolate synthase [Bacteroidetes bacterium]|nr:bifunctional folylpolyglutamate synthase/dihydrofolate synthase [Bacteroidota bacterium]
MNYEETLKYLYSKLPMFQRIGAAAYIKDLGNTIALLDALDNPQNSFPAIHVAGTNGKGSVSSMLASILQESGYRVGLHTSPHLSNFTERIRVNGAEMPREAVVDFVRAHQIVFETIGPSFFEATVGMAFAHFRDENVDVAVVEVGMGGRLDSTNIIQAKLGVITNISHDHGQFLGNTLPEIAGEKAGIIKSGMTVILGENHPETMPVFTDRAEKVNARLVIAADICRARQVSADLEGQLYEVRRLGFVPLESYQIDLAGHYQGKNLVTALCAVDALRELGWHIHKSCVKRGLANVRRNTGLRGRMEVLGKSPLILTDVGHNEAGVHQVLEQLAAVPHDQLHLVWGTVNDKEIGAILKMLPQTANYYFVKPNVPRGLAANLLAADAEKAGLKGSAFSSVNAGLAAAKAAAGEKDLIFVGGSTFVVAEVI